MRYVLGAFGFAFGVIAVWFIYAGFAVSTTVASSAAPAGYDGIANLQAMHIQMADFVLGSAAGLAACVLFGAAVVAGTVAGRSFNE